MMTCGEWKQTRGTEHISWCAVRDNKGAIWRRVRYDSKRKCWNVYLHRKGKLHGRMLTGGSGTPEMAQRIAVLPIAVINTPHVRFQTLKGAS